MLEISVPVERASLAAVRLETLWKYAMMGRALQPRGMRIETLMHRLDTSASPVDKGDRKKQSVGARVRLGKNY